MIFNLRNNSARIHALSNRLLVPGTGCPAPAEAPKGFKFPERFELTEEQMFHAHRGVIAAMKLQMSNGRPEVQCFLEADGAVEELQPEDLLLFASDQRAAQGLPEPVLPQDHARELVALAPKKVDVEAEQEIAREKLRAEFLATAIVKGLLAAGGGQ